MIVCLLGYTGSGKSHCSELLKKHARFDKVVEVSDIVRQFSKADDVGTDVINNDAMFEFVVEHIADNCIVSGVRESALFEKILGGFQTTVKTYFVDESERERFLRVRLGRQMTVEEFCKKDVAERKIGLTKLLLNYPEHIEVIDGSKDVARIISACKTIKEVEKT